MYQAPYISVRRLPALCACLLCCAALPVFAGALPREDGPVGFTPAPALAPDAAWQEQVSALPPYPEPERLLELGIDTGASPFRYYLDPESLSVGEDRVVRFTTVIVSPSGVWNVTYEGLRCGDKSHRRLAYGSGGEWHRLAETPWVRVTGSGRYRYRKVLYEKYMCPATDTLRDPEQILRRLRTTGKPPGDY
jgi:hypothetical protein